MTNDKLFQKRKAIDKKSLERQKASRPKRKRALLVCEDSHSAPSYFDKLIKHYGLNTVDIRICGKECASAPVSVVEFGTECLKNDDDFDYVFFVFDRDTHSTYDKALIKISGLKQKTTYKEIKIYPITSTPCFELWLLLHKKLSTKPYSTIGQKSPADCLIDDLKRINPFENYSKNSGCNYFNKIEGNIAKAIDNAKSLIQNGNDTEQKDHYINPATYIHEIVIILQEIADGYNEKIH